VGASLKFPGKKVRRILKGAGVAPQETDALVSELERACLEARVIGIVESFLGPDIAEIVVTALNERRKA
jgi:hypothetical protein